MSNENLEFLGMDGTAYVYKNAKGRVFKSAKKLHDTVTSVVTPVVEAEDDGLATAEALAASAPKGTKVVVPNAKASPQDLTSAFDTSLKGGKNAVKPAEPASKLKQVLGDALSTLGDSNVTPDKVNEETLKLVGKLEQSGIYFLVENDKHVQHRVLLNSEGKLMSEIQVSQINQMKRVQDATYNLIEDAANNYGINSGRPMWQLKLAKVGSNFWFLIWFLLSSFTFTPIMLFLKMIGVQVKSAGLKWFFTIVLYLGLVFAVYCVVIGILQASGQQGLPWPAQY